MGTVRFIDPKQQFSFRKRRLKQLSVKHPFMLSEEISTLHFVNENQKSKTITTSVLKLEDKLSNPKRTKRIPITLLPKGVRVFLQVLHPACIDFPSMVTNKNLKRSSKEILGNICICFKNR